MKPLARYASLNHFVELCAELDTDASAQLRMVGLSPAGLASPDQWIPATSIAKVLESAAAATGREDFGLRMAESRRLSNLGMVSLVIREEPDVRSALAMLVRYEHTYNESLRIRLLEREGIASIRVALDLGDPMPHRQALDLAVGVTARLLRDLIDESWRPVSVRFEYSAPVRTSTHRRNFGDAAVYDCAETELVLYSSDLDRPNKLADKLLQPHARQILDSLPDAGRASTTDRVRELIELLLPAGRCSIEQAAQSLGVDRRTVHRKLAEDGESFTTLLAAVRVRMAEQFIPNPRYSLIDVSLMLGFSTPGSFSRWFRTQFQQTPSQWRAENRR